MTHDATQNDATQNPTSVTVLGLGPMGHALAAAFLTAGHRVTVWNRTPGKGDDLAERGAVIADSPDAAAKGADVVVACLIDYAVVRKTIEGVTGPWTGRTLINVTSGEPSQARDMASWAAAQGIRYLDGAILTPTPAIGTPAGAVLFSGDEAVYASVQNVVAAIGGTALFLGADPGLASAYDVALLDLFATAVSGVTHSFALAVAEGIEPVAFAAFATGIGGLLPEMITRMAEQVRDGEFPGHRSTIASAAAGIRHIRNAAAAHGLDVGVLTAAQAVIDRAVADGHGADGLARLTTTVAGSSPAQPAQPTQPRPQPQPQTS